MRPASEAELSEIVRAASGPLRLRGGGTRSDGAVGVGALLETSGLTGISVYEPGALTLVAGAGTPLAEVEAALATENQRLPFEPMDMRALLDTEGTPTLGGMVATNASGPRRVTVGACRDSLIGVRFVDGQGTIVKNGGRVMKNVTGYDLVKLMAGSRGTLGVLTECSVKLLPVPEVQATLVSDAMTPEAAVRVMSDALGTPYEVNAAARDAEGRVCLRLEGFSEQIAYRKTALAEALGGDWHAVEGDASAALWRDIRDVTCFGGQPGDVWRISVRPSDAPALVAKLAAPVQMDWGGGLVWALVPQGTDLRAYIGAFAGHATLIRGKAGDIPMFHPEPAPIAAIAQGLRARFDPRGVLNPGLMG